MLQPTLTYSGVVLGLLSILVATPGYSQDKTSPPRTAFTIPLEAAPTGVVTETRAVIYRTEGRPDVWFASAHCDACRFESLMRMNGMQDLFWADGAVHVHTGRDTTAAKSSSTGNKTRILPDGQIAMVSAGSLVVANKLTQWTFRSEASAPLIFQVIAARGYVHIGGRGTVVGPDGKPTTLK